VLDHTGVNAPGKPTMIVFLPAVRATMSTFSGGNPKSIDTDGILAPTALNAADDRKERVATGNIEWEDPATARIIIADEDLDLA